MALLEDSRINSTCFPGDTCHEHLMLSFITSMGRPISPCVFCRFTAVAPQFFHRVLHVPCPSVFSQAPLTTLVCQNLQYPYCPHRPPGIHPVLCSLNPPHHWYLIMPWPTLLLPPKVTSVLCLQHNLLFSSQGKVFVLQEKAASQSTAWSQT